MREFRLELENLRAFRKDKGRAFVRIACMRKKRTPRCLSARVMRRICAYLGFLKLRRALALGSRRHEMRGGSSLIENPSCSKATLIISQIVSSSPYINVLCKATVFGLGSVRWSTSRAGRCRVCRAE